jgi:hypothetical protein
LSTQFRRPDGRLGYAVLLFNPRQEQRRDERAEHRGSCELFVAVPPVFTRHAASQAVRLGGTLQFVAQASRIPAPAYQRETSTDEGDLRSALIAIE